MALALHIRTPTGRLAQYVSSLWVSEGTPPEHKLERVLPYGNASLILNLAEDRIWTYERESGAAAEGLAGAIVAGPRSRYEVIDTECQKLLAGVTLRAEGAALLLGAPVGELTDSDVPLDALWGEAARRWRERVMEARTAEGRLAALESGLTERLPEEGPPRVVAYGVEELRRGGESARLAAVAEATGLSQRRFIELFRQHVGMGPKVFQRVQRFQAALRMAHAGRRVSWSELALECGYYDQSHFVRDFREFSGMTPGEYAARARSYANHVAIGW